METNPSQQLGFLQGLGYFNKVSIAGWLHVKVLEPTAQFCHYLAMRPWARYLTSQYLNLPLCEMGELGESTPYTSMSIKWANAYEKLTKLACVN